MLFNCTNSQELVGKTALSRERTDPVTFSNHFYRIRTKKSELDPEFLALWLADQFARGVFGRGCVRWVNQATYRNDRLVELKIPLPPLAEQKRIAAKLHKADKIRNKRKQLLQLADDFLRSLYFDTFAGKGRPVHSLPLSKCLELINGRAFKTTEWKISGKPIIRIQNLKDSRAEFNYFSGDCDPRHEVKKGDLLLSWAGQLVSFGVHIWPGPEGVLNQHIFKVVTKVPFDLHYLERALSEVVRSIASQFRGIEMKHLTKEALNQCEIPYPDLERQRAFGQVALAIAALKDRLQDLNIQNESMIAALSHQAFRGGSSQ